MAPIARVVAAAAALLPLLGLAGCKRAVPLAVDAGGPSPAAATLAAPRPAPAPPPVAPPPAVALPIRVVAKGKPAAFTRAAIATADPLASEEAARLLAAGGNAMDAAVAAALVLGVVEPHSAGLGGGGFLLHYDAARGAVRALDYRERAPRRATRDMYRRDGGADGRLSLNGFLAVGVPGTPLGLFEAHRAYGRLPWAAVVEPAARIAAQGFPVRPRVAEVLRTREPVLRQNAAAVAAFYPKGTPPKVGERLVLADLAATLRTLAAEGPAPFYTGAVAARIAAEVRRGGGILDEEDLRAYRVHWREPLRGQYAGAEIVTMPPPSSGGVHLLQILRMVELRGDVARPGTTAFAHVAVEAMRRAYADRAEHLGDPGFVKVPVAALLADDYLKERAASIDLQAATASVSVRAGTVGAPAKKESEETTHLSVLDAEGNAVSLTQSINFHMGACVVVPGTGLLLNDTMDDFAIAPGVPNSYGLVGGEANAIAPGKTPLSSMTPTFVMKDKKPWLVLGSPGGSSIITAVAGVLLGRVARKQSLSRAVNAARLHQQWLPDVLFVETDRPGGPELAMGLRGLGHFVKRMKFHTNVQAVELAADGRRLCASDPRRDGACAGY